MFVYFVLFCTIRTSDEVLHVIGNILEALQRGRLSLIIPKKKPIDELIKGRNMVNVITLLFYFLFYYFINIKRTFF